MLETVSEAFPVDGGGGEVGDGLGLGPGDGGVGVPLLYP